ncbi:MAG TPA: hypothetical protein VHY31_21505 [Streptosporangiaceae bacterium]|jgi:hypothetical protein|nr:hypothetical protein [Streptosporangiaceae bacterium]
MIRIEHVRLPDGLQAFARLEDGTVVVYVSAELSAAERTTAIARALRAAPEAGWRDPHRPVLLPALAGGARLRLVPESRWAYRGLAAVPVAVAAAVVALALLGGSDPASPGTAAPGMPPVTAAPVPAQPGPPGTAQRKGPGLRSGSSAGGAGSSAGGAGSGGKGHGKTSGHGGGAPAPQGSGRPSPTPTATQPGSPKPAPDPKPSPSPSPSSCVSVLGITVCL